MVKVSIIIPVYNVQEYIEKSSRTSADLDSPILNNLHYTIGMATEVGELLDVFKKYIAYGKMD